VSPLPPHPQRPSSKVRRPRPAQGEIAKSDALAFAPEAGRLDCRATLHGEERGLKEAPNSISPAGQRPSDLTSRLYFGEWKKRVPADLTAALSFNVRKGLLSPDLHAEVRKDQQSLRRLPKSLDRASSRQ
jgi:hypothetical protein